MTTMGNPTFISNEELKLIEKYRKEKIHEEYQYLHLLENIIENGVDSDDRTGVGTRKIFGTTLKFSLRDSFPILTTKRVYWKGVVEELLWFIRGDTNANHLKEKNIHIWDGNTTREFLEKQNLEYPEGYIGPGYGWQWRNWNQQYNISNVYYKDGKIVDEIKNNSKGIDQLKNIIEKIKITPNDRRLIVSAFNPSQLHEMALPPCHLLYQFQVSNGELHCVWYQRSVDTFLGLPFNISSYALLTNLIAKITNLKPGTLAFFGADTHLYKNHFEQVKEQLSREPYKFPILELPEISSIEEIEELTLEKCKLIDYNCHKSIKAEMAV